MKISPRQCRQARSLLKWNIHDLANHARLTARRLDSFERGTAPLHQPENDKVVKTFKQNHIEFLDDFDVRLNGKPSPASFQKSGSIGTQVSVSSEELLGLSEDMVLQNTFEAAEKEDKKSKLTGS